MKKSSVSLLPRNDQLFTEIRGPIQFKPTLAEPHGIQGQIKKLKSCTHVLFFHSALIRTIT